MASLSKPKPPKKRTFMRGPEVARVSLRMTASNSASRVVVEGLGIGLESDRRVVGGDPGGEGQLAEGAVGVFHFRAHPEKLSVIGHRIPVQGSQYLQHGAVATAGYRLSPGPAVGVRRFFRPRRYPFFRVGGKTGSRR